MHLESTSLKEFTVCAHGHKQRVDPYSLVGQQVDLTSEGYSISHGDSLFIPPPVDN